MWRPDSTTGNTQIILNLGMQQHISLLGQVLDFPFQIRTEKSWQTKLVAYRRGKGTAGKARSQRVVCC